MDTNTINNIFKRCYNPDKLKQEYRKLSFLYHPDINKELDSTEVFKEINNLYHNFLKLFSGQKFYTQKTEGFEQKEYTYQYNEKLEQIVIDKLNEAISAGLPDINILLIGNWIWVTGTTTPVKEYLKGMKFRYHPLKKCWVWSATKWKGKSSRKGLDEIASKYGYQEYKSILRTGIN